VKEFNAFYYKRKYTKECEPDTISKNAFDSLPEDNKRYYTKTHDSDKNTNICYRLNNYTKLTGPEWWDEDLPESIKSKYNKTPEKREGDTIEYHYNKDIPA
jgi:hypothetical protein